MKYLLLDFGASFVKCAEYDSENNEITNVINIPSPFYDSGIISKSRILSIINSILLEYPNCKKVMSCSILGGEWIGDIYHSWKVIDKPSKPDCLISGLFRDSPTHHVHKHHGGDSEWIKELGKINDVLFYSSLGDTYCVIECMDIEEKEYIINIGTGSQVISKQSIHKYIPAGRALIVFANFFNAFDIDMFKELGEITINDCITSDLIIDLNVFRQSHMYKNGGQIANIQEHTFNRKNLFGSILRTLVCQYKMFIEFSDYPIKLCGGIPQKLPIIKKLFEYYYQNPIMVMSSNFETHTGLTKFIQKIEP